MSNVKISELSNYTNPQPADVLPVVDVASGVTKKVQADVLVGAFLPTAMISPYAGSTAPTGWLLCDGSAVSRATYSALFTLVGTSYGAGDGSTTFNLPDLRGKVAVGLSSETEFNALGKTGGAKTHTLTTSQIPAHSHTGSTSTNGSHTHGYARGSYNAQRVYNTADQDRTMISSEYTPQTDASGSHSHSFTTANTGGGGAHNNLQPFQTINYIIKA